MIRISDFLIDIVAIRVATSLTLHYSVLPTMLTLQQQHRSQLAATQADLEAREWMNQEKDAELQQKDAEISRLMGELRRLQSQLLTSQVLQSMRNIIYNMRHAVGYW